MSHLILLPILLPMLFGSLLLIGFRWPLWVKRMISLTASFTLLPVAWMLLVQADLGDIELYALGNWQAPFGIALMMDRLNAGLILLTALLGFCALIFACHGDDKRGPNFHALYQFQMLGINGAFLTGDLFNLFVFFEILLISSYALLLHGGGKNRVKAGLSYVILNLVGSSFFLIGVAILYGVLGTLNMADLAIQVRMLPDEYAPLVSAAGLLLLLVFGLKAAMMPLCFWLPGAYAAATAPVAALFAILTKVGLYAIIRVYTLIYGGEAGLLSDSIHQWLWPIGLLTIVIAVVGVLSSRQMQVLLGNLVVLSVGTLLVGISFHSGKGLSASLFYMVHSTLTIAGLFLLANMMARQRGQVGDELVSGPALRQPLLLGGLFFYGSVAVAGLPPLSGFLGKLMLLQSAPSGSATLLFWAVLLIGGFATIVALSRAGSLVFWKTHERGSFVAPCDPGCLAVTAVLLGCSLLMVVWAQPLYAFFEETANQLLDVPSYLKLIEGEA